MREFRLEAALPSMEVGPFDFAPLIRDCSERVFLVVVSVLDIVEIFLPATRIVRRVGGTEGVVEVSG